MYEKAYFDIIKQHLLLFFNCSVVSDSLQPQGLQHVRLPCPSAAPNACSNSCPLSRWCHPTISFSVVPFSSCLQSFPDSGSFSMSQFFTSGGQSTGLYLGILFKGFPLYVLKAKCSVLKEIFICYNKVLGCKLWFHLVCNWPNSNLIWNWRQTECNSIKEKLCSCVSISYLFPFLWILLEFC